MKNLCLLLLCLPILACNPSTPTTDSQEKIAPTDNIEKKKAIILKNIKAFSQALMNQDYDTVVDAYTDDAKIFPQNSKILTGKDAIRKYWTPPAGSNRKTTYHTLGATKSLHRAAKTQIFRFFTSGGAIDSFCGGGVS